MAEQEFHRGRGPHQGSGALEGKIILLVEDEYIIAADIGQGLGQMGATVIGPAASLDAAMDLIRAETQIDVAVLDVNLHGQKVFPAADLLRDRGIPFLFATGYDQSVFPTRFASVPRCEKPLIFDYLGRVLARLLSEESQDPVPAMPVAPATLPPRGGKS